MLRAFDFIILAVLVIAIVMLITGNGEKLMGLFSSKQTPDVYQIYEKEPFHKATLIFCLVLLADELVLLFLSPQFPFLSLVSVGVTVAAFAFFIFYIKQHRK